MMVISRRNSAFLENFLEEIGERYLNLVGDLVGLAVPSAYCAYLMSTGRSESTILIDGGNSFNPYLVTHYSRLLSVDEREVMGRIQLSRAFTCHQMSALLSDHLESAVRRFGAGVVIISNPASLYVERAAEEDVLDEFQAAYQRLLEITYAHHLTTLMVHSCHMPRFLDGGAIEDGRRERASRCTERTLSKLADSIYRLEEESGGFSVMRIKHPYFPRGSSIFIPKATRPRTLDEVLQDATR